MSARKTHGIAVAVPAICRLTARIEVLATSEDEAIELAGKLIEADLGAGTNLIPWQTTAAEPAGEPTIEID